MGNPTGVLDKLIQLIFFKSRGPLVMRQKDILCFHCLIVSGPSFTWKPTGVLDKLTQLIFLFLEDPWS